MLIVNIDGASRGNPGPSAIGIVIAKDNLRVTEHREFIGKKTNNEAEYAALKKALEIASKLDNQVTILSDSQLVVNQRNSRYKVRSKKLKNISREISTLEGNFKNIVYKHIARVNNEYADSLANLAIDEHNNNKSYYTKA